MAAIVTDQLRILNAKNFVEKISSENNSYYSFIGLPNPYDYQTNWDESPPAPKDNFTQEDDYWDTMIALKKINSEDIRQVVPKRVWTSGTTYDMYRHDYSRTNIAPVSGATNLYSSSYFIINSEYRVYICLQNNSNPDTPGGGPSLDEPLFTDLEPRAAGDSGDGYIWKYLYTIKPADVIKFETTDFIPVPKNWATSADSSLIRNNAIDGSIKTIVIKNRGSGLGEANTYFNVPIKGDGSGSTCTIVVDENGEVSTITVSNQGSGYTFGSVDLSGGNFPTGDTIPSFDIIISPKGGHGYDIYRELGAFNVLMYSRIENDNENPDFITGNQIARIGIVENPEVTTGTILTSDKVSSVYAIRLTGTGYSSSNFAYDSYVTQTISTGTTAVGRVISYNPTTGVLKYWQDRNLSGFNTDGTAQNNPTYGFNLNRFTSSPSTGGNLVINGNTGGTLFVDTSFTGISTTINNRIYYLGQTFTNGISSPEVKKYSGNIIYVDNRPAITRSSNQKEDIKVILQF